MRVTLEFGWYRESKPFAPVWAKGFFVWPSALIRSRDSASWQMGPTSRWGVTTSWKDQIWQQENEFSDYDP